MVEDGLASGCTLKRNRWEGWSTRSPFPVSPDGTHGGVSDVACPVVGSYLSGKTMALHLLTSGAGRTCVPSAPLGERKKMAWHRDPLAASCPREVTRLKPGADA